MHQLHVRGEPKSVKSSSAGLGFRALCDEASGLDPGRIPEDECKMGSRRLGESSLCCPRYSLNYQHQAYRNRGRFGDTVDDINPPKL